jgi:catechol 2,3-dioxygenase-like lactoylglutathione lyase family enzyme
MPISGLHHLVLLVDEVPEGESFYRRLFDMDVLFREGVLDGEAGTVPEGMDWSEAVEAGVTPTMAFLGRDDLFLALAQADDELDAGRVDHIALAVDESAFEAVTERAEELGCEVERNAPHHRVFEDRWGFEWELNARSRPPDRAFDTLDV